MPITAVESSQIASSPTYLLHWLRWHLSGTACLPLSLRRTPLRHSRLSLSHQVFPTFLTVKHFLYSLKSRSMKCDLPAIAEVAVVAGGRPLNQWRREVQADRAARLRCVPRQWSCDRRRRCVWLSLGDLAVRAGHSRQAVNCQLARHPCSSGPL